MEIKPAGHRHGVRIWDCQWQDRGRRFHRRLRGSRSEVMGQIAALCAEQAGESIGWARAGQLFNEAKAAAGRSPGYLRRVDEALAWWLPRLPESVQETRLVQIAEAVALKAKETSARTANLHWQVLRAVARWLQSQGKAGDLPFLRFRSLPESPKASRALPAQEIARYLQALPEHVQLPVACCAVACLRTGAVCRLSREDVQPGEIAVMEKGRRVRLVVRDKWLDEIIRRTVAREVRPDAIGTPLFVTRRGRRWKGTALLQAAQRAWKAAGLAPDMTIHEICRHGPATLAGAAGHEVDELRSYLGHESRRTSERYVHRDEATAAAVRAEIAPEIVGFLWGEGKNLGDSAVFAGTKKYEMACPKCGHKFLASEQVASNLHNSA